VSAQLTAAPPVPAMVRGRGRTTASWPVHWPLATLVLGFGLWWLLGIAQLMTILVALPMLAQLWRRGPVLLPHGWGWWSLFLVWVSLGIFVLWADAPGAVPGGGGGRLGVFLYGFAMYLACTVALVWVSNLTREELPFGRLARLLSWVFVITTVGGVLGLVLADVQLKSALELLLPGSLTSNSFVRALIHPQFADVQEVLGRPEARPTAPFPYANTWGSALALSLPFFVVAWFRDGSRRRRIAGAVIALVALVPIVFSLNRGLWICLAVGAGYLIVVQLRSGRVGLALAAIGALAVAAVVFWLSPLGGLVGERLENQHSNDRREELLVQTVESAATGSPVIGFGGTRDVQGSFASIAGGSTADCPACGVPPLGTQGHLWLVIFAQGLVGAVFFLLFFLTALWRTWQHHSTAARTGFLVVSFFAIQMFVYDTLSLPLMMVMLAIGAAWRESVRDPVTGRLNTPVNTVSRFRAEVGRNLTLVVTLSILGAVAGLGVAMLRPRSYVAKDFVLLAASPSYLELSQADAAARETTIDTEAALIVSEQTLGQVVAGGQAQAELRDRLQITAIANTRVLVIALRSDSSVGLEQEVADVTRAYLVTREDFLINRRSQLLVNLTERTRQLDELGVSPSNDQREALDAATNEILLTPTTAGETVRVTGANPVSRELLRAGGSGLASGLLVAAAVIGLRRGRGRR